MLQLTLFLCLIQIRLWQTVLSQSEVHLKTLGCKLFNAIMPSILCHSAYNLVGCYGFGKSTEHYQPIIRSETGQDALLAHIWGQYLIHVIYIYAISSVKIINTLLQILRQLHNPAKFCTTQNKHHMITNECTVQWNFAWQWIKFSRENSFDHGISHIVATLWWENKLNYSLTYRVAAN